MGSVSASLCADNFIASGTSECFIGVAEGSLAVVEIRADQAIVDDHKWSFLKRV